MTASAKRVAVCLVMVGSLMLAGSSSYLFGHHGGNIEWFNDKVAGPVTVIATKLAFTFPHPQFYGEIKDEKGNTQSWSFVIRLTPTGLRDLGWTRNSIKPGDTLTVTYHPHKTMPTVAQPIRVLINGKFLPLEAGDKP